MIIACCVLSGLVGILGGIVLAALGIARTLADNDESAKRKAKLGPCPTCGRQP